MANNRTGVIEFDRIKDEDGVLSEFIVDKNSWDLHDTIKLTDNEDYVAFRNKPFIRISPRKYAIIDITFVIDKLYNGLYFELNSYCAASIQSRRIQAPSYGYTRCYVWDTLACWQDRGPTPPQDLP